MGFHTFDVDKADRLERPEVRYRWVSAEELIGPLLADAASDSASAPAELDAVADLGSGTGFYTDVVAPHAKTVYGVDIQSEMHELYREKGVPENVELVASDVAELPFADGGLDGAVSTMTYHEFASPAAIRELARVLDAGAPLVVFDWSAAGDGEHGPSPEERYAANDAVEALESEGFDIVSAAERTETFGVIARAP